MIVAYAKTVPNKYLALKWCGCFWYWHPCYDCTIIFYIAFFSIIRMKLPVIGRMIVVFITICTFLYASTPFMAKNSNIVFFATFCHGGKLFVDRSPVLHFLSLSFPLSYIRYRQIKKKKSENLSGIFLEHLAQILHRCFPYQRGVFSFPPQ